MSIAVNAVANNIRTVCNQNDGDDGDFKKCVQEHCTGNLTDESMYEDPLTLKDLQGRVVKAKRGTYCFNDSVEDNGPDEYNQLRRFRHWVRTRGFDPASTHPVTDEDFPEDWPASVTFHKFDVEVLEELATEQEIVQAYNRMKANIVDFCPDTFRWLASNDLAVPEIALDYFDRAIQYVDYDISTNQTLHSRMVLMLAELGFEQRAGEYFHTVIGRYGPEFDLIAIRDLGYAHLKTEAKALFEQQVDSYDGGMKSFDVARLRGANLFELALLLENRC
jgi:hypothetical protein